VLTPKDLVLLREALVFWARETHVLDRKSNFDHVVSGLSVAITPDDMVRLLDLLSLENVRYIVVDSQSNHTVNTRLFKTMPTIHPSSDRWQVRSVIG